MLRDDLVGKQIGDFRIEARIGRGGMATVYRAYQVSVNRHVALKIIPYDLATESQEFQRRFAQEAEVIASLEHIHILPIYGYGVADGLAYLAMRLLSGGSLNDLLSDGALPLDQASDIFGQIARGLGYAHSKGLIHRDLKPSNILLDDAGNAYLTDFGLAKWIEGSPELTKTGNIVGTPAYMAPEQLRGEPVDQRADIYSMGIILYHMIVGRAPYDMSSSDIVSIIYQHLEKEPIAPKKVNPDLPDEVEAVILRALEKDPNKRFQDVRHMADELDRALGRKVGSTYGTPTPMPRATPRMLPKASVDAAARRNRMAMIAGAAVVLLIGLIAGAVILTQNRATPLKAVVQTGEEKPAGDVVPSESEIAAAQQALGSGFIAYVTCNQTSEYHATQAREMGDFARDMGLEFRIYDSDTDEYNQITQLERARADGARALIVCPLNPELLDNSLKSVQKSGLPLAIMSSEMPSYGGVLIAGDDYLLGLKPGQLAGKIIADEMGGKADVIILDYPSLAYIVRRADGLENGMKEFAPEANVIGRFLGATRDFAEESVTKLIEDGVHFDVILSINDAGSFGAIAAMEKAGIASDEVIIASVDAEAQAREYISEGRYISGSVDPGRTQFSRAAINSIVKLLAGGTLPERVLVPPGDVITRETLESLDELQ